METNIFFAFISALFISMALIPPLIRSAGRLQIMDFPGERKLHAVPIARVGGVAFAAGTFISILIWNPRDPLILTYLFGALVVLLFGVWDDCASLNFKTKFLTQILAALLVVVYGKVRLTALPFFDGVNLSPWFSIPLTVVFLLAMTNAMNLSDGLDGLAGGLSLLSFSALGYLAWISGDQAVLVTLISILGGIFGFLRFNSYPATVFMGDGGSQFLGFSLGALSLILTDSSHGPYSPLIALMVAGLPVLDTMGVMLQRGLEGRSLFLADKNHTHHKLIAAGLLHHEAVILIYLFQIGLVTLACLLRFQDDGTLLLVYSGLILLFFLFFLKVGKGVFVLKGRELRALWFDRLKTNRWLTGFLHDLIGILIPLFLGGIVFVPGQIPKDFGSLALGLLVFLVALVFFYRKSLIFGVRMALYVGGAFGIYLSEINLPSLPPPFQFLINLIYLILAGLLILTIWGDKRELFQTTPLDYLILCVVLIVSLMMKLDGGGILLGLLAAKLLLLFYASELLLTRFSNRLVLLSGLSIWTLIVIGLRGWLLL